MKENRNNPSHRDAEADGVIEGRNAVIEALRAGTAIDKIYLAKGETDAALGHIASAARSKGVVVVDVDRRKLDYMSRTRAHQGVIAMAAVREYASVEDILARAEERGEPPLIVVCDELSDPHNLGAVIRRVRRRPRGCDPQAAQRGADRGGGQNLCRSGVPSAGGPGPQPDRSAEGAEKRGGLDLWRGHERYHWIICCGSEGACGHRHRQRGQRHEPAGGGNL